MKHTLLISLFAIILFANGCKKEDDIISGYDLQILEEINNYRLSNGLTLLEHNEFLWELAKEHSLYMAQNETSSNHDGIEERYEKIIEEFGHSLKDENVSSSNTQKTAKEVVDSWLADISQKENLDGNFTITGISAVKSDNGTWYFTQIFYKQ